MSEPLGHIRRRAARALTMAALGVAAGGTVVALAATRATVRTNRGCYLVGMPVHLRGGGFAPNRTYAVSIEGVYFGRASTDAGGRIHGSLRPGGLPAGVAQAVDRLQTSDGTRSAQTTFTLTRAAGARFLATSGSGGSLRAPVEVWGFALNGRRRAVYLHYVDPAGHLRTTVGLGHTGGQCGYLKTAPIRVFPFTPSRGTWTLQIDTRHAYARRPGGPVQRIAVRIGG